DLPIDYAWAFGDGGTAAGAVVTHSYAATGTYVVVLTATNECGQQVLTDTLTVEAEPVCTPVDILELSADAADCQVLFGAELEGDPPFTRLWSFGDGYTSTQIAPVHVYDAPGGTYTVTLEVSNCGGAGQDSDEIVVVAECAPDMFYLYLPLVLNGFDL
ncbi:MAG: PKD domain-containing protein, partial [Chloroflexia bacterium]|nr:PKD domain-containing protein [Chloroflexia bacterium]